VRPWEERSYWRDVGTLDAYRAALQDVAGAWPRFELSNPEWPIRGERRFPGPNSPHATASARWPERGPTIAEDQRPANNGMHHGTHEMGTVA
jgi:hypothetical protein